MRKLISQLTVAAGLISVAMPAMAWGEREQGILSGIAGAWIIGRMMQQPPAPQPPPVYYNYNEPPPPVYYAPPPTVYYYHPPKCYFVPFHDPTGRILYYRQICR